MLLEPLAWVPNKNHHVVIFHGWGRLGGWGRCLGAGGWGGVVELGVLGRCANRRLRVLGAFKGRKALVEVLWGWLLA